MSRDIRIVNKVKLSENQRDSRTGGKLLFTDYRGQRAALYISDNRLRAAQFFPVPESKIGAVYIAKVKNVVKNLDACFVEIGGAGSAQREICFLSKKDCAHPYLLNRAWDGRILEGDELPVQIVRDAQKTKQASVTTLISLSNAYFALSVGNPHTGYSNKLTPEQKNRVRSILEQRPEILSDLPIPAGLVVRTRSAELLQEGEQGGALLLDALEELLREFSALFHGAVHRTCFSCLKPAPPPWRDALDHLVYPEEYEEILTDNRELYEHLCAADCIPGGKKIRFYSEKEQAELSLSKLYGLDSKLETALDRRVWLKSGGYLIIEPTEALTVIDVNSGKYESSGNAEKTCMLINREAAEEIALQLRLRNLSGMIIVDFINMKSRAAQEELLQYLTCLTAGDHRKTTVVDITPLGLVEITRKKSSKPLAEQFTAEKRCRPGK